MNWEATKFAICPSSICTSDTGRFGNAVPMLPVVGLDFGVGG